MEWDRRQQQYNFRNWEAERQAVTELGHSRKLNLSTV